MRGSKSLAFWGRGGPILLGGGGGGGPNRSYTGLAKSVPGSEKGPLAI